MASVFINSSKDYAEKAHLLPAATSVEVRNCPGLTALHLPAATSVDVWRCPGLTALHLPAATSVEVWDCPSLTALAAPAATSVDVWRCPGLGFTDERGHTLYHRAGDDMFFAGCHAFTRQQAIAHWSAADYPDPRRGAAFVAAINATQNEGRWHAAPPARPRRMAGRSRHPRQARLPL